MFLPFRNRRISSAVIEHVYKILVPSFQGLSLEQPPFGNQLRRKKNGLHFMTLAPTEARVIKKKLKTKRT